MILDLLKDRFAIVAQQGYSVGYAANSPRALMSAVPFADIIMADVTLSKDDVLMCSDKRAVNKMTADDAVDHDVVPLDYLVDWAKQTDKQLLLNPRTADKFTMQAISRVARSLAAEDMISVVARTLAFTQNTHAFNDKLGIVGILKAPQLYTRFYDLGGHVGSLAYNETASMNVRLAEAAIGRHRHPFLVQAPEGGIQDVYNACNGLTGASGIIMRNPELGREAMERRAFKSQNFPSFLPD